MAATIQLIAPLTAAIADKSKRIMVPNGAELVLMANGLAGAETFTPYVGGSNGWTQVSDGGGLATLTATKPQMTLPGGCHYAIDKSVTAGNAGLDYTINYYHA